MTNSKRYPPAGWAGDAEVRGQDEVLIALESELDRLHADDVQLALDDQFEPAAGTLLRVEIGLAFWHLPPEEFQRLTRDLPGRAGSEAIKEALETNAMHLWHGPSPRMSRDTST